MSESWGIVDCMGHVVYAGRLSTEKRFGAKFCRIDVPETDKGPAFVRLQSPRSIYAITPCGEAVARQEARYCARPPGEPEAKNGTHWSNENGTYPYESGCYSFVIPGFPDPEDDGYGDEDPEDDIIAYGTPGEELDPRLEFLDPFGPAHTFLGTPDSVVSTPGSTVVA